MLDAMVILYERNRLSAAATVMRRHQDLPVGLNTAARTLDFIQADGEVAQGQPQAVCHGREQLERLTVRARAAAQGLAIHGQARDYRDFLLQEPVADDAIEPMRVQLAQHAIKG